jgi:hypothetical protein
MYDFFGEFLFREFCFIGPFPQTRIIDVGDPEPEFHGANSISLPLGDETPKFFRVLARRFASLASVRICEDSFKKRPHFADRNGFGPLGARIARTVSPQLAKPRTITLVDEEKIK